MTPKVALDVRPEEQAIARWQARAARPGHRVPSASFNGCRVLTLESRRSPELALLIVNYGGKPVIAPSVREVPLEANVGALEFVRSLIDGEYPLVVLMTGVGTRMLLRLAAPVYGHDVVVRALGATRLLARGPKPVAALREVGLAAWLTASSPNTWREVITTLDGSGVPVGGVRAAIQEYGSLNRDLVHALEARGMHVTSVPIYQWALPDDLQPLRSAIDEIIGGRIDMLMLTASVQLVHLMDVAAMLGADAAVRTALQHVVIASIGPMTSEEAQRQGLSVDFEPSHPKMGFLVKEAAEQCAALLATKRSQQSIHT